MKFKYISVISTLILWGNFANAAATKTDGENKHEVMPAPQPRKVVFIKSDVKDRQQEFHITFPHSQQELDHPQSGYRLVYLDATLTFLNEKISRGKSKNIKLVLNNLDLKGCLDMKLFLDQLNPYMVQYTTFNGMKIENRKAIDTYFARLRKKFDEAIEEAIVETTKLDFNSYSGASEDESEEQDRLSHAEYLLNHLDG